MAPSCRSSLWASTELSRTVVVEVMIWRLTVFSLPRLARPRQRLLHMLKHTWKIEEKSPKYWWLVVPSCLFLLWTIVNCRSGSDDLKIYSLLFASLVKTSPTLATHAEAHMEDWRKIIICSTNSLVDSGSFLPVHTLSFDWTISNRPSGSNDLNA